MKNKKMIFIGIMIGVVISSACFVVADTVINSNHVTFKAENNRWNATTVDGALNDLYTYASSYKNLNQNTTFSSDDLVLGKTAYNKDGVLVTGTHKEGCVRFNFVLNSDCTTSAGCTVFDGFNPTLIIEKHYNPSSKSYNIYYYDSKVDPNYIYQYGSSVAKWENIFVVGNNKFRLVSRGTTLLNQTLEYFICQ